MKWKWKLEAYSELCQTAAMELFVKVINVFKRFTIFAQGSILDVWQDTKYVHGKNNTFSWRSKYHILKSSITCTKGCLIAN